MSSFPVAETSTTCSENGKMVDGERLPFTKGRIVVMNFPVPLSMSTETFEIIQASARTNG